MIWPFRKEPRKPSINREVESLKRSISDERGKLYTSLFKLDNATNSLAPQGVGSMLDELFRHLDEAKRRDE